MQHNRYGRTTSGIRLPMTSQNRAVWIASLIFCCSVTSFVAAAQTASPLPQAVVQGLIDGEAVSDFSATQNALVAAPPADVARLKAALQAKPNLIKDEKLIAGLLENAIKPSEKGMSLLLEGGRIAMKAQRFAVASAAAASVVSFAAANKLPGLEAEAHLLICNVLVFQAKFADSIVEAETATRLATVAKNAKLTADSSLALANSLVFLGKLPEVTAPIETAERIYSELHDTAGLGKVNRVQANLASLSGKLTLAIEKSRKASELFMQSGDPVEAALSDVSLANQLVRNGQYAEANAVVANAIPIIESVKHPYFTTAYYIQGTILAHSGNYEAATKNMLKVRELATKTGQAGLMMGSAQALGYIQTKLGKYKAALGYAEDSIKLLNADMGEIFRFEAVINAAEIAALADDFKLAETHLNDLNQLAVKLDSPYYTGRAQSIAAIVRRMQGKYSQAIALHWQAQENMDFAPGYDEQHNEITFELCRTLNAASNPSAPFWCRIAFNEREQLSKAGGISDPNLIGARKYYEDAAIAFAQAKMFDQADVALTTLHNRELGAWTLRATDGQYSQLAYAEPELSFLKRYDAIVAANKKAAAASTEARPAKPVGGRYLTLFAQVDAAFKKRAIREQSRAQLTKAAAATANCGERCAAIKYLVTDRATWIFYESATTRRTIMETISRAELGTLVKAFRSALQSPSVSALAPAQQLNRLLLAPIAAELNQDRITDLQIEADDVLRYIPFAALHDGKSYLVERYTFKNRISAAKSEVKNGPGNAKTRVAAFADPTGGYGLPAIPAVVEEARMLASGPSAAFLFSGRAWIGSDFSLAALSSAVKEHYSIIHISSHFALAPGSEADSFLILGGGRRVTLTELDQSDLQFDGQQLVVLAACSTGVDTRTAFGREVDGLGQFMLSRNARAVISTLWSTSDSASVELMRHFYSKLTASGEEEALRAAQLDLIAGKSGAAAGNGRSHPYYWAPYVLTERRTAAP
ncbi:MAG: CHAT domain-containing protein [Stagnimonas sp.]|nr:CHAT domain-containing protein [Stagnimonas sp.]